ncbi:MAG: DNA translocase FtsK [Firmicutes bacterium]|nr:DNA translocase FtsK [Bacillota bacterium]
MAARRKARKKKKQQPHAIHGIVIIFFAIFCYAGLFFTPQTGTAGFVISYLLKIIAGEGALLLPLLFLAAGFSKILHHKISNFKSRFAGLLILILLALTSLHLKAMLYLAALGKNFYNTAMNLAIGQQGGGFVGAILSSTFFFLFRDIGSYIVIIALVLISVLLLTDTNLNYLLKGAGIFLSKIFFLLSRFVKVLQGIFNGEEKSKEDEESWEDDNGKYIGKASLSRFNELTALIHDKNTDESPEESQLLNLESITVTDTANMDNDKEKEMKLTELENNCFVDEVSEKPKNLDADYQLPPINLLTKVNRLKDQQQNKVTQERARVLENTLSSFGVKAKVVQALTGPTVTRFELQPEVGVKVSKILSLADDLALNLAAPGVRIEAPIPGKAAVGIEVPNKIVSIVYLRDVLEDSSFKGSHSPLLIALGKDITGKPVFTDLLKMPHLLIAGSTGSGKSVCLNTIVASILFSATPRQVKFLMIDPKMVELSIFNGLPHLISPVIADPKKASIALRNTVKEMIRRYDLFAKEGVREITRYNELENNKGEEGNPLPYIVVIIDELADLMMVSPAEVEDSIVRLSQMARAAGIHLIIATQRPSVDVLTGIIKANITSRIAFAVSSQADSRTILDMAGAEKLLGRGDMLFHPVGAFKPIRVQGAYISERDLSKLVEFIKKQDRPIYNREFVVSDSSSDADGGTDAEEDKDPLLCDAIKLIMDSDQASISMLQRRFRIGYTRAARLIDELEVMGVIGKHEGSKPRQVIMSKEEAYRFVKKLSESKR